MQMKILLVRKYYIVFPAYLYSCITKPLLVKNFFNVSSFWMFFIFHLFHELHGNCPFLPNYTQLHIIAHIRPLCEFVSGRPSKPELHLWRNSGFWSLCCSCRYRKWRNNISRPRYPRRKIQKMRDRKVFKGLGYI